MLHLQNDKGANYFISWKSKGLYSSILFPSYTHLLHSINLFGYKMGIKFDEDPLVAEKTRYITKVVNAYIVYMHT